MLRKPPSSVAPTSPHTGGTGCWWPLTQVSSRRSCGFFTGKLSSSTFLARVKMAVLAPIPSASETIAMVARDGLRRSWRAAKRRSRPKLASDIIDLISRWLCCSRGILPNCRCAAERASSGLRPRRMPCSVSKWRCIRISSSKSWSAFCRPNKPPSLAAKTRILTFDLPGPVHGR